MDVRLPLGEEEEVRDIARRYSDIFELRELRTRKGGYQRYIDLILATCQHTSVGEVHQEGDCLDEDIRERFLHSIVTPHVEPFTLDEGPCPTSRPINGR